MNKKIFTLNKIIVAICLAIFVSLSSFAVFNHKGMFRTIDLGLKVDDIRSDISLLKKENRMLVEAIRSYRSENFQIEKIAREELGMAKENEIVIKIVNEKKYLPKL
jgi:cell division protein FtsB|tara:strand:- start:532 stop:849 length:318 start_codon:yes stop_codon:yes gene_type:complete